MRITTGRDRRLRIFAVTQIAASFVLLAGATMLVTTLLALQAAETGFDTHHVLALNVPVMSYGRTPPQIVSFYKKRSGASRRLPGVEQVAVGTVVPWRDAGAFGPGFQFSGEGYVKAAGRRGSARAVPHGVAGILRGARRSDLAGRDFNESDRQGGGAGGDREPEPGAADVPGRDPVNRHMMWTDPIMKFIDISTAPRRIVGVAADVDDENVVPGPAMTVYHPFDQRRFGAGDCSFTRTAIRTHSRLGSRARSATCRRISRWSGRRRSTTCARRCWRRTG